MVSCPMELEPRSFHFHRKRNRSGFISYENGTAVAPLRARSISIGNETAVVSFPMEMKMRWMGPFPMGMEPRWEVPKTSKSSCNRRSGSVFNVFRPGSAENVQIELQSPIRLRSQRFHSLVPFFNISLHVLRLVQGIILREIYSFGL